MLKWRLTLVVVLVEVFGRNAVSEVLSIPAEQWVRPFDNQERLGILCTDNNHFGGD
jgi:hypothetical protein